MDRHTGSAFTETSEEWMGPFTPATGVQRQVLGVGVGCNLHSCMSLHQAVSAVIRQGWISKNKQWVGCCWPLVAASLVVGRRGESVGCAKSRQLMGLVSF